MTLVALSPLRAVHAGASSTWLATMRPPRSKNLPCSLIMSCE